MLITIDTKLKLLAGLPLQVENYGEIKPLILKEIISFGYDNYLKMLNILCLKKDKLMNNPPEDLNEFDVLLHLGDEHVHTYLKESLEFFLQDKVTLVPSSQIIVVGSQEKNLRAITRKNFNDIRTVVQLQNYILSVDDDYNIKSKDDKAKEIADRMKKAREEVKRIKKKETNEESDTDFFDLLSAISAKSYSLNKIELLNLTMFQIYEEFKRLNHIDQYETNISAMLQGAKGVKLKHWSSKIKY
jgi:hypothetical protein